MANLPRELLDKHLESLSLEEPVFICSENDLFDKKESSVKSAVVFLPKSKALIDMTLSLASGFVTRGGKVVLTGEKSAGIESAKSIYEKNIGPIDKKIVGNHSALYIGENKKLGALKKADDFLSYHIVSFKEVKIEAASLPGVFSAGEIDEGTRLLLENIPFDKRKVLDIGCGAGIIGAIYAKRSPESEVTMSDMSKLAVLAAEKTLEANKLSGKVIESDVFGDIKGAFDLILCNPPFHKGIATDYSFIEKLAKGAKGHMNPGGKVFVVANSFLPYGEILERYIGKTDIITDTKKFRVYRSGL